jgi:CRISPR-associated protein Csc2
LKDVTPGEFVYVLGNILRSSRYGAISSRVGKVRNEIVACIFSDCELFSNLELTQHTWDRLCADGNAPEPPLDDEAVRKAVKESVAALQSNVFGRVVPVTDDDLAAMLQEVQQTYANETTTKTLLAEVQAMYKK